MYSNEDACLPKRLYFSVTRDNDERARKREFAAEEKNNCNIILLREKRTEETENSK